MSSSFPSTRQITAAQRAERLDGGVSSPRLPRKKARGGLYPGSRHQNRQVECRSQKHAFLRRTRTATSFFARVQRQRLPQAQEESPAAAAYPPKNLAHHHSCIANIYIYPTSITSLLLTYTFYPTRGAMSTNSNPPLQHDSAGTESSSLGPEPPLPERSTRDDGSSLFFTMVSPRLAGGDVISLFEGFGTVETCRLVRNPETRVSLGFGFVKMATPEQAEEAQRGLHGTMLEGQKLYVSKPRVVARGIATKSSGSPGQDGSSQGVVSGQQGRVEGLPNGYVPVLSGAAEPVPDSESSPRQLY